MKKLLALLLALIMVFTLAACGEKKAEEADEKDDEETTEATDESNDATDDTQETQDEVRNPDVADYIVTVVDEEGNPIEEVTIQFCDADGCSSPVWTQEDGTAMCRTFRRDDKVAKVLEMPEGYTYAGDETEFSFDENDKTTIVLKKEGGEVEVEGDVYYFVSMESDSESMTADDLGMEAYIVIAEDGTVKAVAGEEAVEMVVDGDSIWMEGAEDEVCTFTVDGDVLTIENDYVVMVFEK